MGHMESQEQSAASGLQQPSPSEKVLIGGSRPARPPSIRDVAKRSGVAFQTVSRVINDSPNVAPDTRARVLAAITELGYRPSATARALVSGRSNVVAILSIGTSAFEAPSTLDGIDQAASAAGYAMTFSGTHSQDPEEVRRSVGMIVDLRAVGCVLLSPRITTDVDALKLPEDLPLIVVEGDPDSKRSGVSLDQVEGARLATEHLLDMGHANVWHVSGPQDWFDSRERERGWRQALESRGITPPPVLAGDWNHHSGFEAGRVIAGIADATAVFVANDSMALGLMHALHEAGRHVPEDVSVVGFDDLPEAAFAHPPLTTIRQEFFEVGRASIAILMELISKEGQGPIRKTIVPELVIRRSTAAPRA